MKVQTRFIGWRDLGSNKRRHFKKEIVILSEAKDLLSLAAEKQQVLRFAQDDKQS
jgi:hypothetical protein